MAFIMAIRGEVEIRANNKVSSVPKAKALVTRGESSTSKPNPNSNGTQSSSRQRPKCTHCGRLGHLVTEGKKLKGKGQAKNRNDASSVPSIESKFGKIRASYFCGRNDHLQLECLVLKKAKATVRVESGNPQNADAGTSFSHSAQVLITRINDSEKPQGETEWITDSRATDYFTNDLVTVTDIVSITRGLCQADGSRLAISDKGNILFLATVGKEKNESVLTNVLVAPALSSALFSVPTTYEKGNAI